MPDVRRQQINALRQAEAALRNVDDTTVERIAAVYEGVRKKLIGEFTKLWTDMGSPTTKEAAYMFASRIERIKSIDDVLKQMQAQVTSQMKSSVDEAWNIARDNAAGDISRMAKVLGIDLSKEKLFVGLDTRLPIVTQAVIDQIPGRTASFRKDLTAAMQSELIQGASFDQMIDTVMAKDYGKSGKAFFPRAQTSVALFSRRTVIGANNISRQIVYQDAAQQIPGLKKQAVAAITPTTTQCCLHVHGQIRELNEPYELTAEPYFQNRMLLPPFFWNCRTSSTAYHPAFEEGSKMTTDKMKADAADEIAKRPTGEPPTSAAPKVVSPVNLPVNLPPPVINRVTRMPTFEAFKAAPQQTIQTAYDAMAQRFKLTAKTQFLSDESFNKLYKGTKISAEARALGGGVESITAGYDAGTDLISIRQSKLLKATESKGAYRVFRNALYHEMGHAYHADNLGVKTVGTGGYSTSWAETFADDFASMLSYSDAVQTSPPGGTHFAARATYNFDEVYRKFLRDHGIPDEELAHAKIIGPDPGTATRNLKITDQRQLGASDEESVSSDAINPQATHLNPAKLVTLSDGSMWVQKVNEYSYGLHKDQAKSETLAYHIGKALGAPVPETYVLSGVTTRQRFVKGDLMQKWEGLSHDELQKVERSREGLGIAALDFVQGNCDRRTVNFLVVGESGKPETYRPIAIDNGFGVQQPIGSYFYNLKGEHFYYEWAGKPLPQDLISGLKRIADDSEMPEAYRKRAQYVVDHGVLPKDLEMDEIEKAGI